MRLVLAATCVLAACSAPAPGRPDGSTTPAATDASDAGTPVPAGDFSGSYTDHHGRRGRYVGWVPEGLVRPGALVFLHSDDGGDLFADWINETTKALATAHHLVAMSVQEPDDGCWWAPKEETDAHYLGDLVADELVTARQVDSSRVYLVGESGGAFFAAGVPALLRFPFGGAVIGLCGGDVPRRDGGNCDDDTDAPVAKVPLFSPAAPLVRYWFATTAGDEYRPYAVDAAAAFGKAGAEVTLREVGRGGHCEFDELAELTTALSTLDP